MTIFQQLNILQQKFLDLNKLSYICQQIKNLQYDTERLQRVWSLRKRQGY